MNPKKTGEFIRDCRKKDGLTQEDLADRMFVSRQTISDIELGKTEPTYDKVKDFANILNVSILDIFNGEKTDKNDVKKTNETITNINNEVTKSIKSKYSKILITIITLFIIVIFSILVYYFFNSYNSVKFYKVVGESENFITNEGLLIISKENINFSLSVSAKEDLQIKKMALRYKENDKDELVQELSDSYFYITDYYNYNEFFDYKSVAEEKGKFYIEVDYGYDIERIDLSVVKQYENKRIFFRKEQPITDGKEVPKREKIEVPQKILDTFTYDESGAYGYEEKTKDCTIFYAYFIDANLFMVTETYENYTIDYLYYLDIKSLDYCKHIKGKIEPEEYKVIDEFNDPEKYNKFFNKYYSKYFEK